VIVTRLLSLIFAGSFLLSSIGCGNVFVRGAILTGSTIQGSVSTVEIGSVMNGTGGTVQVTFVTFLENGTSSTIGFCADRFSANPASLFPLGQTVMVNFNPGQPCATVITVVIVG
jgi:hypothetical protein